MRSLALKALITTLFLLAAGFVLLFAQYLENPEENLINKAIYYKPCDTPITYRLGSIDPKFNLTENEAKKNIQQSVNIWEDAYGKPIFKEDASATLTVSFIYDERQQLRSEMEKQEDSLDTAKDSLDIKIANYESKVADYKRRAAQLNKEIESWNSKGGAPTEIYNRLINEVNSMSQEAVILNNEAQKLNQEAQLLGKSVETLNDTVSDYNTLLDTKPEEGLYDPNSQTISIYLIGDRNELISTLAHEFGHALGFGHVENLEAIMYSQANSNLKPTREDLNELEKACQQRSRLDLLTDYLLSVL